MNLWKFKTIPFRFILCVVSECALCFGLGLATYSLLDDFKYLNFFTTIFAIFFIYFMANEISEEWSGIRTSKPRVTDGGIHLPLHRRDTKDGKWKTFTEDESYVAFETITHVLVGIPSKPEYQKISNLTEFHQLEKNERPTSLIIEIKDGKSYGVIPTHGESLRYIVEPIFKRMQTLGVHDRIVV
jgi:hypothetical protein